jgi:hypothetical protein
MGLSKDWREFLELLNSCGVDYVIVGAHSLALHGRPPYTGDLNIFVRSTPENARLLVDLLNDVGFAESGFKEADFLKPEQLIQLGRAPTRIGLLTSISGVSSDEAFASKVSAELDGIPVSILGKDALIRNKRAVGRPQDLIDIDMLEKLAQALSCRMLFLLVGFSAEPASLLRLRFFRRGRRFGGFLFLRSRLLFFRCHRF